MGIKRHLLHFLSKQERDAAPAPASGQEAESEAEARARIQALQNDLGRIARVTRALEGVGKGLMTTDELLQQLRDADIAGFLDEQERPLDFDVPEGAKQPPPEPPARKGRTKRRRRGT